MNKLLFFIGINMMLFVAPNLLNAQTATLYRWPTFDEEKGLKAVPLGVGNYFNMYKINGIVDNSLNSIKVPKGLKVTLFQLTSYAGDSLVLFHGDYPRLYEWANQVSSIRIAKTDPNEHLCKICTDVNLKGDCHYVGFGNYSRTLSDNNTNSMYIPDGYIVTVYEHSGFRSTTDISTKEFTSLQNEELLRLSNLQAHGYISSYKVRQEDYEVVSIIIGKGKQLSASEPIAVEEVFTNESSYKDFSGTKEISETKSTDVTSMWENSIAAGFSSTLTIKGGVRPIGIGAESELSLTASIENTVTFGESKTTSTEVQITSGIGVDLKPGESVVGVMMITPIVIEYPVTYYLESKTGKKKTIKERILVRKASKGRTYIKDNLSSSSSATAKFTGSIKKEITCSGKKYILDDKRAIWAIKNNAWTAIGSGCKSLSSQGDKPICDHSGGKLLQYNGTTWIAAPAGTTTSTTSSTASGTTSNSASAATAKFTGSIKKEITCSGKKYILDDKRAIWAIKNNAWTAIGSGCKSLSSQGDKPICDHSGGKLLQYNGTTWIAAPAGTTTSTTSSTASGTTSNSASTTTKFTGTIKQEISCSGISYIMDDKLAIWTIKNNKWTAIGSGCKSLTCEGNKPTCGHNSGRILQYNGNTWIDK